MFARKIDVLLDPRIPEVMACWLGEEGEGGSRSDGGGEGAADGRRERRGGETAAHAGDFYVYI